MDENNPNQNGYNPNNNLQNQGPTTPQGKPLTRKEQKRVEQKAKDAESNIANAKTAKVAAEGVATYFGGRAGGKAVHAVGETKVGKAVFNVAGKVITASNKVVPLGKNVQKNTNRAYRYGLTDAADKVVGGGVDKESIAKEGAKTLAKEGAKEWGKGLGKGQSRKQELEDAKQEAAQKEMEKIDKKNNRKNKNQVPQQQPQNEDGGEDQAPKTKKQEREEKKEQRKQKRKEKGGFFKRLGKFAIFIIIGLIAITIILFVVILGPILGGLLDLTEDLYKPTPKNGGSGGSSVLTPAEIQRMTIYVGDHRMRDMSAAVSADGLTFLYNDSGNSSWLASEVKGAIAEKVADESVKVRFVVINLGLYDLNSYDTYYTVYENLTATFSDVHFMFLGLGPIKDGESKVTSATNQKIQIFNSNLKSKVGEDNFLDIYGMINTAEIVDGDSYTATTYSKIHQMVLTFIKEHFATGVPYLLDDYPLWGNGSAELHTPVMEAIGADAYDSIDGAIKDNVQSAGLCTKSAVAAAGVTLIYGLHQGGYHLPYYWAGGHSGHFDNFLGMTQAFGSSAYGSTTSPGGNVFSHFSFDCSGFVSWCVRNATNWNTAWSYVTTNFMSDSVSDRISFEDAEPGDILVNEGHIILIVENKGSYLVTAESGPGVVFGNYNRGGASSYEIRSIQKFLDTHCYK